MGAVELSVTFIMAWWLVFLPILSMGTRSQAEADAVIPGTDTGAPEKIKFGPKLLAATIGAVLITGMVWLALYLHWLDFFIPKQAVTG